MIFRRIKDFFRRKYVESFLRNETGKPSVQQFRFESVLNVLIHFDYYDPQSVAMSAYFCRELSRSGIKCTLLSLSRNNEEMKNGDIPVLHYTSKDFNWYGKPVSARVLGLIMSDYDILFDINRQERTVLPALFRSKLKVGINNPGSYFDINYSVNDQDPEKGFRSLTEILKKINA